MCGATCFLATQFSSHSGRCWVNLPTDAHGQPQRSSARKRPHEWCRGVGWSTLLDMGAATPLSAFGGLPCMFMSVQPQAPRSQHMGGATLAN